MADAGVGEAAAAEGAKTASEAVAAEAAAAEGATAVTASAAAGEASIAAATDAIVGGELASGAAADAALGVGDSLLASGAAGEAAVEGAAGALTGTTTGAASFPGIAAANAISNTSSVLDSLSTLVNTKPGQAAISSAGSAAASTLMQTLLAPEKIKAPAVPKVNVMPTANSTQVMAAKKKSIAQQMRSRGRASTILTDKLG